MTTFDEREQGYERKFQRDQELAFKLKARRHRLAALWAAARLGLAGDAAASYAADLATGELSHPGDATLILRIEHDFAAKGIALDAARIRLELERCERLARMELGLAS